MSLFHKGARVVLTLAALFCMSHSFTMQDPAGSAKPTVVSTY